ncbi:hypothetical protein EJB05_41730 [Eragrostis curvula]|uniref:No apical meristem-associated C-terminal domain-containing protein n=1 Tax=Eragrostis curvula TaxID=38414 RepID=A0A5J9TAK2_9POAL|nr:hypothetical protein EJB05_41730 [Eragrostis curvula]
MEDEEMEKKMQQYLQRKGFRLAPAPPGPPPNVPFPSMPGGYVSYLQNGHCYFPAPWPPQGKVTLAEPVSNSTQHFSFGSTAKPVINIDDGDDIRTEKRLGWTPEEDLRLVSAWLKMSNDTINGNCKKTEKYWGAVLEVYNSNTPTKRHRQKKHLKDRFQRIKRMVWFFCNSLKKAASENCDGQSEVDLRDTALKYYLDDYNEGPFTVMHCWKALRDEPKWHAILEELEKSNKRKLGDDGEVGNSTPVSEETGDKECPPETKQAKKHCNGKSKLRAEYSGLKEDMMKFFKLQAAAKRRHEEFMEVQQRISNAKVEAAKLKRETAMLKSYKSFMTMDTREMSDEMKAEHMMGLKILREKLFGSTS